MITLQEDQEEEEKKHKDLVSSQVSYNCLLMIDRSVSHIR
jgi:hypothetical protein